MTCVKQDGWRDETKNFISASVIYFPGKPYVSLFWSILLSLNSVSVNGSFEQFSHLGPVSRKARPANFSPEGKI